MLDKDVKNEVKTIITFELVQHFKSKNLNELNLPTAISCRNNIMCGNTSTKPDIRFSIRDT